MRATIFSPSLNRIFAAGTIFLASVALAQSQPISSPTSDQVEVEFWRSATSLNITEAYRAYLQRYPRGSFSILAEIAIQKLVERAPLATVTRDSSQISAESLAKLRSKPTGTNSLEISTGARLIGPGVFTAGHWGAKRQILVPFGEWILIAAFDHDLKGFVTVNLTTVVLLKTDTGDGNELLSVTFNRRSNSPTGVSSTNATPSWSPADSCRSGVPQALYYLKDSDMRVQWCSAIVQHRDTAVLSASPIELRTIVASALRDLQLAESKYRFSAETHVSDRNGTFTSYEHLYQKEGHSRLLTVKIPYGDVRLATNLTDEQRKHYLQQAHFAYHAAMAHQRQYETLELSDGRSPDEAEVNRLIGRDQ